MKLNTTYLGLPLRSPLIVGASPLSDSVPNLRRMEAAGAGAIVLHSLFEEQIRGEALLDHHATSQGTESHPEAAHYFPEPAEWITSPEAYLRHVREAKKVLGIPVIASLNGTSPDGWSHFARDIEAAGADALELNLYSVPTDPTVNSLDIEDDYLRVVRAVRSCVGLPLAVKIGPYFTNLANMARRIADHGANGLVFFNSFAEPDVELETLEVLSHAHFSTSMDLRLPLRWIALLHDRLGVSLAASGGVHRGTDVLKALMAGADVVQVCSVLMRHGIDHLRTIERELQDWMREHDYESVEQLRGSLSRQHCPDPTAFERAQYLRAVGTRR